MASKPSPERSVEGKAFPRKSPAIQSPRVAPLVHSEGHTVEEAPAPLSKRRDRCMNQSLMSLITNVGSNANLDPRFKTQHSEGELEGRIVARSQYAHMSSLESRSRRDDCGDRPERRPSRQTPDYSMMRSLPALRKYPIRKKHKASLSDAMTSSQILVPPTATKPPSVDHHQYPFQTTAVEGFKKEAHSEDQEAETLTAAGDMSTNLISPSSDVDLADMLARIFEFKERDEVVAEYPCMLMQSSFLRGYLYILQKHICFYAYLPKRSHAVAKSGYISKRGRQNPMFNRYWFILKGDVLSYYSDRSQLYFPRNTIDLRSATSAQLIPSKDKDREAASFSITMNQSSVVLKSDSTANAKEWVKHIQTAIFRSHNDGDSVKIALPIPNLLDIEENPILDVADTFRLRVIDNDETYAVDEYFFSFFGCGHEALISLRSVMENVPAKQHTDIVAVDSLQEASTNMAGKDLPSDTEKVRKGVPTVVLAQDTLTDSRPSFREPRVPDKDQNNQPPEGTMDIVRPTLHASLSSSRIQDLLRAGAYPLQKASGIAGLLRTQSKRVGNLLATESMGYYEKAYSMWAGKKMHYDDVEGPYPRFVDRKDYDHELHHGDRFRAHFALPTTERLQATYYSFLHRVVPVYGKIYVGKSKVCFRSLLPGTRTKMILPVKDIENVVQEKGFRFGYQGLVITIRGHEEIFFEFGESDARDDCVGTLLDMMEEARHIQESRVLSEDSQLSSQAAKFEHDLLQLARKGSQDREVLQRGQRMEAENDSSPILFDDPFASIVNFKPPDPLRITCLTIGSRGDVQPFIALCKGLIAEGHRPTLATHSEFEDWIRGHGIDFAPIAGNPAEIMRLCVEHDMFTISFIREAHAKFRGVIDDILSTAWTACQGSDLLIESPSAMAGIHIAEALQIPYFRAFTMPWTRTRAYPHAFAVPTQKLGGTYNVMTYVMFDTLFWQAMAGQINRWRKNSLGIASTNLDKLQPDKVPFLYNFSPSVVVPPLDFNHWIRITGYWFLDEGVDYVPDELLAEFIRKARDDDKKIVYVGFGSIVVDDPAEITRNVVEAIIEADVRCILSKGWSDRLDKEASSKPEIQLPDSIFQIQSAPHDWLFRQVDAAAHHGGAGTTGASIRAGIPTIAKPFFGDQYFFGSRVEDLGIGICLSSITASGLGGALRKATTDSKMIERARVLGERIRSENGVDVAIQAIYRDMEYARSLIKCNSTTEQGTEDIEESWTLVSNESDPDIARRFTGPQGPEFQSSLAQRRQSAASKGLALSEDEDETSVKSSDDSASESGEELG